jgi:peptide/nickel transport system permease protein
VLRYIAQRVAMAFPILLGVTVIVFLIMNVLPGDPISSLVSDTASPAERAAMRAQLGLDRPLPVRYVRWLGKSLSGDLGYSVYRRREVSDLIGQAWSNTAILALCSASFGLVGGTILGFVAGVKRGRWQDKLISVVSLVGLSVPSFWLAILALIILSSQLGLLPSAGTGLDGGGFVEFLRHLTMPMIAGSLATLAITTRVTRASIVESYNAEFVHTLRAKGLTNAAIFRHVFRNALAPMLTTSGLQVGYLLGGSVLIETIFRWPGMGTLVFNAISARDLLVVSGATLVVAITFVLINLFVDCLQAVVDPRLRQSAVA